MGGGPGSHGEGGNERLEAVFGGERREHKGRSGATGRSALRNCNQMTWGGVRKKNGGPGKEKGAMYQKQVRGKISEVDE